MNFQKDCVIVECGPGNGVFSWAILRQMTAASKLFLIESNGVFINYLNRSVRDPRVKTIHGNASDMHMLLGRYGVSQADYLILGIPFSFLNHNFNHQILANSRKAMKKGGKIIIYQFSPRIKKYLTRHYSEVRMDFELFNVPPLFIFEAVSEGDLCE